jgi:DNA-binding transcriptional MerR regulator
LIGVEALLRYQGTRDDGHPDDAHAERAAERLGVAIAQEPNHPHVLWWMWRRVEALVALRRQRDVIAVAAQARAMLTSAALRRRFNTTDDLLLSEVVALDALGEHGTALERVRALLDSMEPRDRQSRPDIRGWLAELLARAGRDEEAQAELRSIRLASVEPASLRDRLRRTSAEVDARLRERRRSDTRRRRDGDR